MVSFYLLLDLNRTQRNLHNFKIYVVEFRGFYVVFAYVTAGIIKVKSAVSCHKSYSGYK